MYDIVNEINNIMCLPRKEWTAEQEKIMKIYADGRYYIGQDGDDTVCQHKPVRRYLLTSSYLECKLCGEEISEDSISGPGIGVGGMNR